MMDNSDQDFADLCSKLLKRVRKKPGKPKQPRKAEHQPSSQASDGDKKKRNNKKDGDDCGSKGAGTQPVCTGAEVVRGGTGHDSGDAGPSVAPAAAAAAARSTPERHLTAKDKVLLRMQQFHRVSPQRMVHKDKSQTTNHENSCVPAVQRSDSPESFSSGLHPEPQESDEALALRLQQELDREAAEAQVEDLEDGGLFFCQICHKDLSHMTPDGRSQHLNRCLDKSEESAPALPPPPDVPDCPICGRRFKAQKSRSAHLKRCSSDMGVPPAVLLQALQRQAEETQNVPTANTLTETGGTKRKGPSKSGLPARKKPRKKTEPLDEDTMVALALSSSLLEKERESERQLQTETAASHISMTPVFKWKPDAGKGRGKKKKKGAVPRPLPLLLVQDAEATQRRLQERVSALLLRTWAPSPPTPTRCPSSLPGWNGAAPLWEMSSLLDEGSSSPSDFYTPELREFIAPKESATTDAVSSGTIDKPQSSVQPASEGTPVLTPAPSTPGTGQLPVGSQTLRDLMELAEDGMTLTQCDDAASGPDKEKSACPITNLSGFIPEESEEHPNLSMSGFLPETTHTCAEDAHVRARWTTDQPGAVKEGGGHRSVALSRLASDLSSMVNNPQLSDVQLQVDSGAVYFAHSFMVYARCPLLAEMVHESGFGVREEGMPAAQRVLMSDVPGQAVFTLLQYLYTARCSVPASLRPHVLELASRFDLQELQQLCEDAAAQGDEEDHMNQDENVNNQTDQAFMDLLRSMWNEEDEDNGGADTDGGSDEERGAKEDCQADDLTAGEISEEKVNEEELEEIYEFAATQRKREEEKDGMEEEEERAGEEEEERAGEEEEERAEEEEEERAEEEEEERAEEEEEERAEEEEEERAEEEEEERADEEEEERADEEEDGEDVFAKLTEPKRHLTGLSVKHLQPNSQLEPSLDRSYNRLFSGSWGVYEEDPSTSGQLKRHNPLSQQHQSPQKPLSQLSGRTLLQSSASVVDDLSLSPPPSVSNLPVPGQSPGQVGDWGTDAVEPDVLKESQGSPSICATLSPDSPQKKKEPELIVLSDSSEEIILSSRSPSPHFPCAVQNLQSNTPIKPQPVSPNKKSSSLELSPDDPPATPVQSPPASRCDQNPVDYSPEVSWLIPSTPLQHGRSTSTSSTQTKSGMRRTQLFPKGDTSSPSSSVFSSPALRHNNRLRTSNSPARVSACVPRSDLDQTVPSSSSLDLNICPKGTSRGEIFAVPPSHPKLSRLSSSTSSKQDTPLHLHPRPCSSTPLHTELHQPPALLATSPLDKRWSTSQGTDRAPSESPEKTDLGSFHLSTLSDPSDPPSSSSLRGLKSPRRHSDSSRQSRRSVESSSHDSTGLRRAIRDEGGKKAMDCENKDTVDKGEEEESKAETAEADAAESSFQHSFMDMDEPPIAFNDSWGLDACPDANPGCFSLRLEDSRGSSQQEHSLGQRDTATSSSSANHCRPSSSSRSDRLLNGHGSVSSSPPSKAHSTQPPTSAQAHTGPSFTPDPTTRTTPEINNSLLDSKIWDSWGEEEEEARPLSQRVNPSARLKTPASSHNKRRRTLVPITPMPHYSDMDTPELKNKLNRFGVRPLPKRQMILKLKEIHQYTHQLVSSDSEDEAPSVGCTAQTKPPPTSSVSAGSRPVSCAQTVKFKEPRAPAATSPLKHNGEEEAEPLSASQGSNTSSTAASEESERSNPELNLSSDSDSDGGISASQAATRHQDRLRAVRSFILSDSGLYTQILQYQPLVLSQLQERLKAAGIRLGAAKLVDYLDSHCITFTTAKPGHSAPSRRRVKRTGKGAKAVGESGASVKRSVTAVQ